MKSLIVAVMIVAGLGMAACDGVSPAGPDRVPEARSSSLPSPAPGQPSCYIYGMKLVDEGPNGSGSVAFLAEPLDLNQTPFDPLACPPYGGGPTWYGNVTAAGWRATVPQGFFTQRNYFVEACATNPYPPNGPGGQFCAAGEFTIPGTFGGPGGVASKR